MEDIKDILQEAMQEKEFQELIQKLNMEKAKAEALLTVVVKLATTATRKILKKQGLIKEKAKPKKNQVCFRCQQQGHLARTCINPAVCKHCKQQHLTRNCPKTLCKDCQKKHPPGHCRKKDTYCKICSVWGLHKAENCPNKGLVGRLQKLERILPKSRPKSTRFSRREKGQFPRRRGRGREREKNPRPVKIPVPMDQT